MSGCDTFIVLPPLTKLGGVIFGKNSDRPDEEFQEIVYYPGKSDIATGEKLKCTYIEIDECDKTFSVILSKPKWMWGAEMGSNSAGVAIGNQPVSTIAPTILNDKKLLGTDLVRLGLERGGTAEGALDVIIQLLEKYGQGGACSQYESSYIHYNSFIIADSKEAWVLETTGRFWIAEKIKDGYRNISNSLSITTHYDKICPDLKTYAIDHNMWDGKGEFNFKKIFSSNDCPRETSVKQLLEKLVIGNGFCVEDMFSVLRNKEFGICMNGENSLVTSSSQVSLLMNSISVHWFTGTPDPSQSVFKPFIFTSNVNMPRYTMSEKGDNPLLWKLHEYVVKNKPEVIEELKKMELTCTSEILKHCSEPGALSPSDFDDLFKDIVETEIKFYK